MPYIYVSGCDTEKNIQQINIRAEVVFSKQYFQHSERVRTKLDQIKKLLEGVVSVYFDEFNLGETEVLSNHEENLRKNENKL